MRRASFPHSARLHHPSEFASVLKGRRVARGDFFVVHVIHQSALSQTTDVVIPPSEGGRLGLIVAKRFARLAVTRNALKRVVRESFRQHHQQWAHCACVVRLHAPVPAMSLRALKKQARQEIDQHFARVTQWGQSYLR